MVRIPRVGEIVHWPDDLPAGGIGWIWWDNPEEDFGWQLLIRCPHGHWATLSAAKHRVDAGGVVSPSIWFKGMCGTEPEWHEHGTLEGWTAADAARWALPAPREHGA